MYSAMNAKHAVDLSYIIRFLVHRIIRLVFIIIDWITF